MSLATPIDGTVLFVLSLVIDHLSFVIGHESGVVGAGLANSLFVSTGNLESARTQVADCLQLTARAGSSSWVKPTRTRVVGAGLAKDLPFQPSILGQNPPIPELYVGAGLAKDSPFQPSILGQNPPLPK